MSQDNEKTDIKPTIPQVVTKIFEANQEAVNYQKAIKTWESQKKMLEDAGQEPDPVPEKTPAVDVYETIWKAQNDTRVAFNHAVRQVLSDESLSKTGKLVGEAEEKYTEHKATLDNAVASIDTDNPEEISDMMATSKAAGALTSIKEYQWSQTTEKSMATIVTNHPEALHLVPDVARDYLSKESSSNVGVMAGRQSKETILDMLASDVSPLQPSERSQAQLSANESRGFRFSQTILKTSDASAIDSKLISRFLGVNITDEQLRQVNPNRFSNVADITPALARLAKSESISPQDRLKLQQEVIGCLQSMLLNSNAMTEGNRDFTPQSKSLKRAVIATSLELIDKDNQSLWALLVGRETNTTPVQNELTKLYGNSDLRMVVNDTEAILTQQNLSVINKRDAVKREQELVENNKRQEEIRRAKDEENAKNKATVVTFGSNQAVQRIFSSIDLGSNTNPAETIVGKLRELTQTNELSEPNFTFASRVANQVDDIRRTPGIFTSEQIEVIDNKGVFGVGRKTHMETTWTCDQDKINALQKNLADKQAKDETLSLDNEQRRLALDMFKKVPATPKQK